MPVDRSIHGSGADGKRARAASRSPPWTIVSSAGPLMLAPGFFLGLRSAIHVSAHSSHRPGARCGVGLPAMGLRRRRPSRQLDRAADSMVRATLEHARRCRSAGDVPAALARWRWCSWLPPRPRSRSPRRSTGCFPGRSTSLLIGVAASTLIAQRSLYDHVAAVAVPRSRKASPAARRAVAHDRRPRYRRAGRGRRLPRRHRKPGRELFRRRRGAGVLAVAGGLPGAAPTRPSTPPTA